ncbi:uncharacterized protein LOC142350766 isoform X2 [Convolutriloba macropyga]|uniref:uncharacterized protein LOC142350766 isoform X2 n=1 Tax=Convolutriloba macropyga TaxID=536237 RepID=UPI003F525A1B
MILSVISVGDVKTNMKTFEAHMYPSDVDIATPRANQHSLSLPYETQGNFSYMRITMTPAGNQCPCEILSHDPINTVTTISLPGANCPCELLYRGNSGEIVIGDDDTHPMTAGEEYYVTIRTFSFHGLQSRPTFIVISLPVDRVINTNSRIEGSIAKYEFEIESGVGSYMLLSGRDTGVRSVAMETVAQPFSLVVQKEVQLQVGACFQLQVAIYSRGSKPKRRTANQARLMLPAPTGSATTGDPFRMTLYRPLDNGGRVNAVFDFFIDGGAFEFIYGRFETTSGELLAGNSLEQIVEYFRSAVDGSISIQKHVTSLPDPGVDIKGKFSTTLCGTKSSSYYMTATTV